MLYFICSAFVVSIQNCLYYSTFVFLSSTHTHSFIFKVAERERESSLWCAGQILLVIYAHWRREFRLNAYPNGARGYLYQAILVKLSQLWHYRGNAELSRR